MSVINIIYNALHQLYMRINHDGAMGYKRMDPCLWMPIRDL